MLAAGVVESLHRNPEEHGTLYITDASHFVDTKGAIGPKRGPARKMSDFLSSVIVAATLTDQQSVNQPKCIKCTEPVEAAIGACDAVLWSCTVCAATGRISNWRRTFWDMSDPGRLY
jgi:hypothetical protein